MTLHERILKKMLRLRRKIVRGLQPQVGRPRGPRVDHDLRLFKEIRFNIFRLVNAGHSPEAVAHAINAQYGKNITAQAVRAWRLAVYSVDASPLDDEIR